MSKDKEDNGTGKGTGEGETPPETMRDSVKRLSRDLVEAAKTMSADEARFLVDAYYQMQEDRKRSGNRLQAMGGEPHSVIAWLFDNAEVLEGQIKRALDRYTDAHPVGEWTKSIYGIGPVITAGFLAHIDINKAPTVGHIWRFAGLDPTVVWEKGKRRPWNASLKTLCWKAGQSFMKFSNRDDCFYGKLYQKRKVYEVARNDRGGNSARAAGILEKKNFAKGTEAYKWLTGCYPLGSLGKMLQLDAEKRAAFLASVKVDGGDPNSGMLPPAQIDAQARRWAVRIFLSHLQMIWWFIDRGELPPKPYVISHLDHAHMIDPPNQHLVPGFIEAWTKKSVGVAKFQPDKEAVEYEKWLMAFLDSKSPPQPAA